MTSIVFFVKQFLDSAFVILTIIKVSVRVMSISFQLQLITPTSTFIILDITKKGFTWTFHALGQISHACQTLPLSDVPNQLKEFQKGTN